MTNNKLRSTTYHSALACLALVVTAASPRDARADRHVSLTLDLPYLTLPVAKGALEVELAPKTSLVVAAGFGRIRDEATDMLGINMRYYEIALQGRYYVLRGLRHGLALGPEVRHGRADVSNGYVESSVIGAVGTAIGAIVAYKYVARGGLTIDLSAGAAYFSADGEDDEHNQSQVVPLLNLNLGWTFSL